MGVRTSATREFYNFNLKIAVMREEGYPINVLVKNFPATEF